MRTTTSAFNLSDRLSPKADPALIAADERHFAAVAQSLERTVTELSERLDALRRAPGGMGREAMERDAEIHRLSARLRTFQRFGLDLCLGRIVPATAAATTTAPDPTAGADAEADAAAETSGPAAPGAEAVAADGRSAGPVYIGRLGLTDADGRRLLVDWRSPAAEPFFAATHARPAGLASRRRYQWNDGRIVDYWDEVFTADGLEGHAALDDQSAFVASLGGNRSERMRDVLATIQADQDAVIRAGSRGALVVDGGPGTGKTVVALHRTAHLLYSDPRLGHRRGGVLFVGPHQPYLAYVSDVLPSLGEEGVRTCTVRDLVPEGATAVPETDPEAARLKSSAEMVRSIELAVRFYEEPPVRGLTVSTPWADVRLTADDWSEAFEAAEGTPHNEARELIWDELGTLLLDRLDGSEIPEDLFRKSLRADRELVEALHGAWPVLDPADLVGDLWSVPAYLRMCAPWLSGEEVRLLQRADARAWTVSDLPLLDAARQRLGAPESALRRRRYEEALAAQRREMSAVVDNLIAAAADSGADGDEGEGLVRMLRGADAKVSLVDETSLPGAERDVLAGPFAHIVVDEAQELSDAEWQMLLSRCPSRSFTVVGDRAQARHGFTESWRERLERVGFDRIEQASLSINYRTPEEVMAVAEPAIRAALPDANVPASVRRSGVPVAFGPVADLERVLEEWLAEHAEGTACVIGAASADDPFRPEDRNPAQGRDRGRDGRPAGGRDRVRSLTPTLAKGLEFDLVVLVDPEGFGTGVEGAVDRYVAMTRATRQLVVLTSA
ncbi:RNA polymerase recycling motor ATPase HelR [Streptomyces roseicoloratus]|uniref:RNA polymerase recycling motor ATPase HelR n=1 Tax=Streptomyces roseicoloratus TaxID=2508722 RepID=UPI001FE5C80B|nr:RNA polymerase recycling motor ATPase HelR [Streptomyces roseicoloratus]